jgi:hypothetical protein
MRGRRLVYAAVTTGLILWLMRTCAPPRPLSPIRDADPMSAELAAAFDPARCGTVRATVQWTGPAPVVPPIEIIQVTNPPGGNSVVPNPNSPRIQNGRVADAVVSLSGVDVRRARPWDLPPVSVEVTKTGIVVKQDDRPGRIAVVRRGAAVELVSREAAQHSVRARGAAFFTQMLPVPDQPVGRVLPEAGVVELSSGSGYYWLRGYLVATDHPYAAVTGPAGTAAFPQAPQGEYEAVVWVPDWHVERRENDPEWMGPVRLMFRPAVERRQRVVVKAGEIAEVPFRLSAVDFDR